VQHCIQSRRFPLHTSDLHHTQAILVGQKNEQDVSDTACLPSWKSEDERELKDASIGRVWVRLSAAAADMPGTPLQLEEGIVSLVRTCRPPWERHSGVTVAAAEEE
jgi:hypothetical protein